MGLTRLLTEHEYGDFKVAHAFTAFFGVAVLLGGDRAAPKALATPLEQGDSARAWEYLRFFLWLGMGLSALVIAVTWVSTLIVHRTVPHDPHHPIAWMSFVVPLYAVSALASRTVQSANLPIRAALPSRVGAPLLFLALLGLAAWRFGDLGLLGVVSLAGASVALLLALQLVQVRRWALPRLQRDPTAREPRQWLATSLPMMAAFLVTLALNQDDLYFLELLAEEHEVGHYAAAATAAHFLILVQVTVIGLFAPLVQPAIEEGRAATRKARTHGRRLMLWGVLPPAAGLLMAPGAVLSLFGAGYPQAAPALQMLVVGNCAWALGALSVLWLHYTGRGTLVVIITLATLALDSALNLLLIPPFGVLGAAGGTAVTMTLAAVSALVLERRGRHSPAPS